MIDAIILGAGLTVGAFVGVFGVLALMSTALTVLKALKKRREAQKRTQSVWESVK